LLAFFSGFEAACQPKSRRWSLSAMTLWPLGVAIYITGAIGESFGANIQRFSVTRELAKPEAERIPKKKQRLWVLGIVCYVLCGIFKAVSYNFAAQTMLAPLTLFLFASNIVFARLINKESFAFMTDGVATLLVVCGVVMCIIAAPSGKDEYTSEEMEELMSAWSFIVWVVVDVSLIVSLWTAQKLLWRKAGGDLTRLSRRWQRYLVFMSFGGLAGLFSGTSATLTKATFSLIRGEAAEGGAEAVFTAPLLYVVSISLVTAYVLENVSVVNGIAQISPIVVISLQSVTDTSAQILGGLLFFQDYKLFRPWQWGVYASGNAIAFVSVFALAHFRLAHEQRGRMQRTSTASGCETSYSSAAPMSLAEKSRSSLDADVDAAADRGAADDGDVVPHPDAARGSRKNMRIVPGYPARTAVLPPIKPAQTV